MRRGRLHGLHGANRLASNSLLEAVVMANRGADSLQEYLKIATLFQWNQFNGLTWDLEISDERVVLTHNRDELQRTMWDYVSIVRTNKRLKRAWSRLINLESEINEYYWNFKVDVSLLELRNMITTAKLVVECALKRKQGLHFNLDYPNKLTSIESSKSNGLDETLAGDDKKERAAYIDEYLNEKYPETPIPLITKIRIL